MSFELGGNFSITALSCGKPFGIRGDFFASSFIKSIASNCDKLVDEDGHPANLKIVRIAKGGKYIVRAENCNTRADAQAMNGKLFYIDRSQLPKLQNGEYYYCDLPKMNFKCNDKPVKLNSVELVMQGNMTFLQLKLIDKELLLNLTCIDRVSYEENVVYLHDNCI